MLPLEKNYWRSGEGLTASLAHFEALWTERIQRFGWVAQANAKLTARDRLRTREAAALLVAGRLMYTSANFRTESRGLHRRTDFPAPSPEFEGQHLISRRAGSDPGAQHHLTSTRSARSCALQAA